MEAYDAVINPFNNPEKLGSCSYRAEDIEAGDEINVTFKAVKAKAMRWRMEQSDKKVLRIEMTFLAQANCSRKHSIEDSW